MSRADSAASAAQLAFWDTVVEHYPAATHGDFPPDATVEFDEACRLAVERWAEYNDKPMTAEKLAELAADARCESEEDWGSERQVAAENRWGFALEQFLPADKFAAFESYALKATSEEFIDYGMKIAAEPDKPKKSIAEFRAGRVWSNDFGRDFPGYQHSDTHEGESGFAYEGGPIVITRTDRGPDVFHVELFGGDFLGPLHECEAQLYDAAFDEGFFQ